MNFHPRLKNTLAVLLGASMALQPIVAQAAIHPVTAIKTESATLETLDLVMNTDYDYDASPAAVVNGITLDRAYATSVLKVMAQGVFTMTEGRHRIGNVFVYRNNLFGNNVDIKLLGAKSGRSNASASGWRKRGTTTNNYTAFPDSPAESVNDIGKVIAHELGHYVYGVLDEYREAGKPVDPADPGAPAQTDTPLNTIMNNHREFDSFSTPGDYVAGVQTAQGRAMGGSAWETLARAQSLDPEASKHENRTAFPAFAGFVPANAAALTKPVAGWDAVFKIVFKPDPQSVDQYFIARNVATEQLAAMKNAAIQAIQRLPVSQKTIVGITIYPGGDVLPLGAMNTAAAQAAAIAAVEAIAIDSTTTGTSFSAPLGKVLDNIASLYSGGAISLGDAVNINLLATADAAIDATTRNRFSDQRVALNANLLTAAAGQTGSSLKRSIALQDLAKSAMRAKVGATSSMTLAQLAHSSGGHFTDAHRPSALVEGAVKAQIEATGSTEAKLATQFMSSLGAGASFAMKTSVLAKTDGKVTFTANWEHRNDNSVLRYELVAPDGTRFAPNNVLAKQTFGANNEISYEFDADSTSAYFSVAKTYPGRNGEWISTLIASAPVQSPVEQVSAAETSLRADVEVLDDGTVNPILTLGLASDRAVQGAAVTALFYGADGALKLTKTLVDNATNGDRKPGDGIYSGAIGGLLPPGQYDVVVNVKDGPSGAMFSSAGSTSKGVNSPPEPLGGNFSRSADTLLTVAPTTVVEFFVPSLKKYFITGRDNEKALLAGFPATYTLTGMSFVAQSGIAPPTGTQPICRFYFAPPLANTHFYGVPADCTLVANTNAGNASVRNEGIDFAIAVPDATGACPASSPVKVYRSFNNRSAQNDGNHRYTVSTARYDQMAAAGYSRDGVVFCAASATDAPQ